MRPRAETSGVAATVLRRRRRPALAAAPASPLYGASPLVEAKGRGKLVIRRLDVPGERQEINLGGTQLKGRFLDFASENVALVPGGLYAAHVQIIADRVPGRCAGQARRDADRSAGCCGWNRRDGPSRLRIRRSTRNRMMVAAIALVCAAASVSPVGQTDPRALLDILTALRWKCSGRSHDPAASPAVVVAIDEESLRTAPLKGAPMLTWTGEIGRVLSATLEGGAKVAGFDIVIRTSIEQSEIPFGEGMLGEKVRGFRPRLPSCARRSGGERQGRAGRSPGRQPAGQAIAGAARRRAPAAEHPPAQRSCRQRRYRAAPAAELHRQRREGALDGGRTGLAGAGCCPRVR